MLRLCTAHLSAMQPYNMFFTHVILNINKEAQNLNRRHSRPPRFVRNDDALSDLWQDLEGLRKAIKEILAGGNIPTHVVTLIHLAGAACRGKPPLLPQPRPCRSETFTPIRARQCLSASARPRLTAPTAARLPRLAFFVRFFFFPFK